MPRVYEVIPVNTFSEYPVFAERAFMVRTGEYRIGDRQWWVVYVDVGVTLEVARQQGLVAKLEKSLAFDYLIQAPPEMHQVRGITSGLVAAFSSYGKHESLQRVNIQEFVMEIAELLS